LSSESPAKPGPTAASRTTSCAGACRRRSGIGIGAFRESPDERLLEDVVDRDCSDQPAVVVDDRSASTSVRANRSITSDRRARWHGRDRPGSAAPAATALGGACQRLPLVVDDEHRPERLHVAAAPQQAGGVSPRERSEPSL
jgi:hypothetical protein